MVDTINGEPAYWHIIDKHKAVLGDIQSVNIDDANLISAAPELLEVAEWIIGKWKNGHHMPPDLLLKARQAIVKAKGE